MIRIRIFIVLPMLPLILLLILLILLPPPPPRFLGYSIGNIVRSYRCYFRASVVIGDGGGGRGGGGGEEGIGDLEA